MMDAYFVARRYSLDLLRVEGVLGVGASKGKILVLVKDPKAIPLLPKTLEQIPLEVRIIKPPEFLQVNPKEKLRPAPGGCSVGVPIPIPVAPRGTTGTLGAWVLADRHPCILSCNHVLAGFNAYPIGTDVIQPGPADGGKPEDRIATLLHFVPLILVPPEAKPSPEIMNRVDVALALSYTPEPEFVDPSIIEVGRPLAFNLTPSEGMRVKKFGRTSYLTSGEIVSASYDILVGFPPVLAYFEDVILSEMLVEPGDSGSVLLDEENRVLGLIFAASPIARIAFACKIAHIVSELRVELAVIPPPVAPFPIEPLFGVVALGLMGMAVRRIVERKQVFADTSSEVIGFGEFNLLKYALEEAFKRATGKLIEEIIE